MKIELLDGTTEHPLQKVGYNARGMLGSTFG